MRVVPSLAPITLFLLFVSASVSYPRNQQILQGNDVEITEATINRLLAAHKDDPVEVMRLVDPVYAATLDEPRLLEVFGAEPVWMTEGDKLRLKKKGLSFMDLTGREDIFRSTRSPEKQIEWPELRYQKKVNVIVQSLKMEEMVYNLGNLTSFFNRFYLSEYGVRSSRWIYDKVLEIIAGAPPGVHVSLSTFTHTFPQASVIARFEPTRGRPKYGIKMPLIIIGAHQDSANKVFPLLPAPGADDDGSGTVTILEAFRALVQAGFKPELPVEFHWYAAEEPGLLGSQDVASEYVYQRKDVGAMIQFDMTAYVPKDTEPTVTFVTTDVDASLTNWATKMAAEYSSSAVGNAKLLYVATFTICAFTLPSRRLSLCISASGASDHMSWHRAGFPAIFATEGDPFRAFNPYIHTVDDRMDLKDGEFSFEHALEFAKVAVGFAVELGGWLD
ncbi:Zn-dependent exopeptidase [Lanmaoa asiatica]|nr:Zn-dependent exopeptidase [Lanmaoa asiatica]